MYFSMCVPPVGFRDHPIRKQRGRGEEFVNLVAVIPIKLPELIVTLSIPGVNVSGRAFCGLLRLLFVCLDLFNHFSIDFDELGIIGLVA